MCYCCFGGRSNLTLGLEKMEGIGEEMNQILMGYCCLASFAVGFVEKEMNRGYFQREIWLHCLLAGFDLCSIIDWEIQIHYQSVK